MIGCLCIGRLQLGGLEPSHYNNIASAATSLCSILLILSRWVAAKFKGLPQGMFYWAEGIPSLRLGVQAM
jgi:hypothetical protein